MAMDVSWLQEGMPIFGFILVFVLAYALIAKTKILGKSKAINTIISFILSIIFISFSQVRTFVTNVTPWFVVLLTGSFFFLMLIFFMVKEKPAAFTKPITIIFLILFALIIIFAIFYSFPSTQAYLPGESESGASEFLLSIKHFILEKSFLNGLLLLVIAIIVGFIITR
jgi:hypothetical protein